MVLSHTESRYVGQKQKKILKSFFVQGLGYTKRPFGHQVAYQTLTKIVMNYKNKIKKNFIVKI